METKSKRRIIYTKLSKPILSLKELENTEDTCPICQSPISHEKHEELSEKYKNDINNFEKRKSISEKLNELNIDFEFDSFVKYLNLDMQCDLGFYFRKRFRHGHKNLMNRAFS